MCEVTNSNFEEKFPEVVEKLHSADFIAIDCEFSGLFDDNTNCSLFDTPKARFKKLQNALESYLIIQFGISTFKYNRSDNSFISYTYVFYLKPTSFLGNQKLTWLMGSVDFLCQYSLDFNKLFYHGIQYINKYHEAAILKKIENGTLVTNDNRKVIQGYCSKVAKWVSSDPARNEMVLEVDHQSETFIYLIHDEIRKTFPNLWTYLDENNKKRITIRKVINSEKQLCISNADDNMSLKKKLFDSILGFSRIMKELEKLNKPIIGHNIFIDLIMIYKQFFDPSQLSYKTFKKCISNTFPKIYDTKTISFKLRELLTRENTWTSNVLYDLYFYLKDGKGATLVIHSPQINHQNDDYLNDDQFHDAGFDSFCTGFCFVKMAHIFSLWDKERKVFLLTLLPTSSSWLLGAVSHLTNCINISRGQVNHIVLNGKDPESTRPGLLYIQSRTNSPLNIAKLLELIEKYGSVDIQFHNKYKGLMAVANRKQLREIIEYVKYQKEFKVTNYNFFKHSFLGKSIVSLTFLASVTMLTFYAMKVSSKLSQ